LKKTIRFNINVENIEKVNPLFSKAKINVLYTGLNRNNTYFSQESVDNALPSIYNIPIIGEYLEQQDNFGGHGGKLEISDQGIKYIQTTQPYGVVPESADISWEEITENDGTKHNYLVIDGAYLWTGRYPDELGDLLNQPYGQSMEVEVNDGEFEEIDGVKTFNIKDFTFSALCILGVDKNGEGEVEPCFESADITAYSLNKDDFKKQFAQMLDELHYSLNKQESFNKGGSKVLDEKLELLKKYSLTQEEFEKDNKRLEEFSLEELTTELENIKTSKDTNEFALTGEQFTTELQNVLSVEKVSDDWGYQYNRYRYVDYDPEASEVFAIDRGDDCKLYGFAYTVNGDAIAIDFNTKARKKVQFVDFEGNDGTAIDEIVVPAEDITYAVKVAEKKASDKYEADIKAEQEKFSKVETELESLKEFKQKKIEAERKSAEDTLFSKFESELSKEEIDSIKANAQKFSIEDLELKLFALVGKNKAKFSKSTNKNETVKIAVDPVIEDEPKLYGGLFEKYNKK
jgi:hypothetical protein